MPSGQKSWSRQTPATPTPIEASSPLGPLSPRETDILRLVATGWTTAEIASAMSLSPKTIHNYHYEVKAKLGARTDAELVHLAMRAGLVAGPEG